MTELFQGFLAFRTQKCQRVQLFLLGFGVRLVIEGFDFLGGHCDET